MPDYTERFFVKGHIGFRQLEAIKKIKYISTKYCHVEELSSDNSYFACDKYYVEFGANDCFDVKKDDFFGDILNTLKLTDEKEKSVNKLKKKEENRFYQEYFTLVKNEHNMEEFKLAVEKLRQDSKNKTLEIDKVWE